MMMISDLPNELESEILSRVPAKSLWELKTTCKRWYALFRDPKFVEKTMKKKKFGEEAVRESLFLSNLKVHEIAGDLLQNNKGSSSTIEFTGKKLKDSEKDVIVTEIFHCDGLMLCSTKGNDRLVVWNPCTGQTRTIKPTTCYSNYDAFALGYTATSSGKRSYKILRRFVRVNDKKVCGEMYDLAADSWRVLDNDSFTLLGYSVNHNGVSLKGDAYFVAAPPCKANDAFLITKFDFATETLVRLSLPFQFLDPENKAFLSVVRDEKISLLHIDNLSEVMEIWVTDKIDDEAKDLSWRSDFVLEICFDTDDNMCFESFLLDEENKVAVLSCVTELRANKFATRIYIAGEHMLKQVYEAKISTFDWPRIITYAPSLVQIQKSTPNRHKKPRLAAP